MHKRQCSPDEGKHAPLLITDINLYLRAMCASLSHRPPCGNLCVKSTWHAFLRFSPVYFLEFAFARYGIFFRKKTTERFREGPKIPFSCHKHLIGGDYRRPIWQPFPPALSLTALL